MATIRKPLRFYLTILFGFIISLPASEDLLENQLAKDLDETIKRAEKYSAIEAENDVQKIQIEKMKKEKNQMISELIEGFRNGNCGIRTICFNDNRSDPYVLFHHSAEELSEERLDELYSEWQEANETPEENEQFESFLAWLEADKEFSYLPVVDAMKMF